MKDVKHLNLNDKMTMLEKDWETEYRFVCYHTYLSEDERCGWGKQGWKNIQDICSEIERMHWEDDAEYLKRYQAEALCRLGMLYVEKGDFDCACETLEKAADLMEEHSFQYIIPEWYIRTYIYLARTYTEKHRVHTKIEGYCGKAGAVLRKMAEYKKDPDSMITESEWPQDVAMRLKVELILMWIIIKSNAFRRETDANLLGDNKEIVKCLDMAWEEILKFEQEYILNEERREDADKWIKLWVRKQKDTYWASKGVYYKWLYFASKDGSYLIDGSIDRDRCFEIAVDSFADGVKADSSNTISAGNIAALLYNYQTEINSDSGNMARSKFLAALLDHINKKELDFENDPHTVEEYINGFLDMVFKADRNNMFALNLKAICGRKSSENETYPYLTLRQSALKKRFDKMDVRLPSGVPNHIERLQKIKIYIINLHSEVAKYMNEAVYPREKLDGLIVGHYTRTSVLPKLLNWEGNSRLRIRNAKHLNDPSEGALFMGYMNHQIDTMQKMESSKDKSKEENKKENNDSLIRSLLQIYEYKRREEWNQKSSVYMGCFTSRIDQLNMWSRYGDAGKGCCLCIDAETSFDESTAVPLAEISLEENVYRYKLEDNQCPLYMVVYLPGNTEIDLQVAKDYAKKRKEAEEVKRKSLKRPQKGSKDKATTNDKTAKERKRCAEEESWWEAQAYLIDKFGELIRNSSSILKQIQEEYQCLISDMKKLEAEINNENWAQLEEEIINTLMMILDQVRFLVKDDSYRDEREYRVIQYSYEPEYESGEDIPKLYVNIEKELKYKSVVFGPLTQNYASDSAYVLNMRKKTPEKMDGKSLGLDVYKSDIPYCC